MINLTLLTAPCKVTQHSYFILRVQIPQRKREKNKVIDWCMYTNNKGQWVMHVKVAEQNSSWFVTFHAFFGEILSFHLSINYELYMYTWNLSQSNYVNYLPIKKEASPSALLLFFIAPGSTNCMPECPGQVKFELGQAKIWKHLPCGQPIFQNTV